jgi:NADH-quinone oxidoreductase subunit H
VLFAIFFPLALVLLSFGIYWAVAGLASVFAGQGWPPSYGAAIANILILMAGFAMTTGALLTVGERKWSAMIQNRIGPNRIRVFGSALGGLPFLLADALKMLTKENIQPSARSKLLFDLAPMLAFAPALALFVVVPVGPEVELLGQRVALQVAAIDAGLLYVFAMASLAVYGTAIAGWASNNKFGMLGGVRASSQMISYEVSLGLSVAGVMMAYSSLRLDEITVGQGQLLWGWLPALGVFLQPVGMLIFFVSSFAETKRAPFDLPEGESEIVGYFVEYPGMKFGMMFLAEFVEIVVLGAITAAIFFGGWHPIIFEGWLRENLSPVWFAAVCAGAFLGKTLLLCWVQLVIRWTLPRFRFDQVQSLCWKMMLPIALVNTFVTGALVLLDGSLHLLAIVGLIELLAMVIMTITVAKAPAAAGAHGGPHAAAHDDHAHAAHAAAGH